jgi:hypothetical protein
MIALGGLAFCYKGENRILWALAEALNHVHEYYTDKPLIRNDEFKDSLNKFKPSGAQYAGLAPLPGGRLLQ